MNGPRRKQIEALSDRLTDLRADLEQLRDEEQEYYDNMPDSLRDGEKGQKAENAVQAMEDTLNNIDEAVAYLEEATQ